MNPHSSARRTSGRTGTAVALVGTLLFVMTLMLAMAPQSGSAVPTTQPTTPAAPRNRTEALSRTWHSWYSAATHLLPTVNHLRSPSAADAAKAKSEEQKLVAEVKVLAEGLKREEVELEHLLEDRAALKRQSWTWFLDPHLRAQVDAASLKINNQRRKVEALFDDITVHWRQLKPLHGVMSGMFLSELLAFLLAPILSVLDFFASILSFGLLFFFLLLGPAAFFFTMFAFSLGLAMLPIIGACLVLLYTFQFPWFIIQYNPSILEFIVAYTPFVAATGWLATRIARSLRPMRHWRYVEVNERPAARPATATPTRRTNVKAE